MSIDQRLAGDELLQQVVHFSKLYRTVKVVSAYDMSGNDLGLTMRWPWILSEVHTFRQNPTRIIYVSHAVFKIELYSPFLRGLWEQSFVTAIMGLMSGFYTMHAISDIKYIIPSHARLIQA
ncbi:hypothetical protein BKA64DRAFT_269254 [Cadophora sp. MPI-SDFR-AT-0126]|nr:hypothetical protein BKA64DRAFT_269254 [Leotiomycetes sp. MPI-SDFR-AT-0126]